MKTKNVALKDKMDLFGMAVSIMCAIHCAFLPILVTLGALSFLTNPLVEPIVIGVSCVIALVSLLPTYLKHGDQPVPLMLMAVGLLLVIASRIEAVEAFEAPLTVVGALTIATAHMINWRYLISLKKQDHGN